MQRPWSEGKLWSEGTFMPPSAEIVIYKFGGSSLATLEHVSRAADITAEAYSSGMPVVVVVSARGTATNDLLALARSIDPVAGGRETDQLLATGETASAAVMALALRQRGVPAVSLSAAQAGIRATGEHGSGGICGIQADRISALLASGHVAVVAGFQGVDDVGDVITLGRGGSDTTAVALAAALAQRRCAIYTDVDGVHDVDPRVVADAGQLPAVDGDVMTELSYAGAKVVHAHAAELAARCGIDLHVLDAVSGGAGTIVHNNGNGQREINPSGEIAAIASDLDVALVSVAGGGPGSDLARAVFTLLGEHSVPIDSIGHSSPHGSGAQLRFTIKKSYAATLRIALQRRAGCAVVVDENVAKVSVIGRDLLGRPSLVAELLAALAAEDIDVAAVSASQLRVSLIVTATKAAHSVRTLHSGLTGVNRDSATPGRRSREPHMRHEGQAKRAYR
jgi:aspartate kinase